MNFSAKTLAALLVTASIPLFAGSAAAAPIGHSLALSNVETSNVEQVQWRRGGRDGRWVGPAIGFGAGVAVGSALAGAHYYGADAYSSYGYAQGPGYGSYGYAQGPAYGSYGYAQGPAYGYSSGFGGATCSGEESHDSAIAGC
jgi:hypothetical protein